MKKLDRWVRGLHSAITTDYLVRIFMNYLKVLVFQAAGGAGLIFCFSETPCTKVLQDSGGNFFFKRFLTFTHVHI